MLNRSIQVKLIKTPKDQNSDELFQETPSVDYVQIARETREFIREHTDDVAKKILIGVVAYVAADTLRRVIVKLTPTN